jgi:hypothetical protein
VLLGRVRKKFSIDMLCEFFLRGTLSRGTYAEDEDCLRTLFRIGALRILPPELAPFI